jgi:hypothetical protein
LGWSGDIGTAWWAHAHDHFIEDDYPDVRPPLFQIRPHITFYKTRAKGEVLAKEKIHNGYYEIMQREDIDMSHEATPPGQKLRHPIPLANEPVHPDPLSTWSLVIQFRTTRVSNFRIGQFQTNGDNVVAKFDIMTGAGEMAGRMVYHLREPIAEGTTCDLICIGRMEIKWKPLGIAGGLIQEAEWFHRDCPQQCWLDHWRCHLGDDWMYKCYNVLWIEWEGGIVYRKAIGGVFEHAWDSAASEEIDVRFG